MVDHFESRLKKNPPISPPQIWPIPYSRTIADTSATIMAACCIHQRPNTSSHLKRGGGAGGKAISECPFTSEENKMKTLMKRWQKNGPKARKDGNSKRTRQNNKRAVNESGIS